MSRRVTGHEANDFNRNLRITARDEPGPGGANYIYEIEPVPTETKVRYDPIVNVHTINFQKGTVPIAGVNGITEEALLAILIDRLQCFQAGSFACGENREALFHAKAALFYLNERTRARITRGVEGTHEV